MPFDLMIGDCRGTLQIFDERLRNGRNLDEVKGHAFTEDRRPGCRLAPSTTYNVVRALFGPLLFSQAEEAWPVPVTSARRVEETAHELPKRAEKLAADGKSRRQEIAGFKASADVVTSHLHFYSRVES